ncbi:MAG: hypothetical protein M1586_01875 [Patescibacteria group bacterium]|nr:hypothetical protein [Patescibacteria group bacterium]MCL5262031.1 hypothetical protein [Patescibacteria group bacterium]
MKIVKHGLIDAGLAILYVVLISFILGTQSGRFNSEILASIIMLLLLVVSVGTMAMLIFGKPVIWYLEGKKKEALLLIFYTLGFLFVGLLAALAILAFSAGL